MIASLISLLFLNIVVFGGKRQRRKSSSTWAPGPSSNTPSPTLSDAELCGCYNIDLICAPIPTNNGEICYYYQIEKISDDDYCKPIEYLSLGTGNLDECGLSSTDIKSSLLDYAPKCYDVDPLYDGTCKSGEIGVPGIKVKMLPSTDTAKANYNEKSDDGDYMVFSVCFDAAKVSGLQESGKVGFKTKAGRYTCDAYSILPNFCDSTTTSSPNDPAPLTSSVSVTPTPITPNPTTPAPVTPSPITPVPITPSPVTPSPVTPAPVTPAPTTPRPTTPAPITPAPTTLRPTTPAPVTPAPTTPRPTTPAPVTPAPVTPAPTTPRPTTPAPVTPAPVTPAPTTARPTTPAPVTPAPTTPRPTTPAPVTPAPTTPRPTTPAPVTPAPVTPAPTTPSPTTPAPVTPSPTTPRPTTAEPTTASPTTLAPSIAPTYVECTSDDELNIAFLLDESGSVDSSEWDIITQFVERIVTFDVSPLSYVALYEYASLASYQELSPFTGPKLDTTAEQTIINELRNNVYNPSGQTETWDAVNRVLDDIHDYKTIDNCNGNGDSCWQRNDILFLVTDGEPTGNPVCGDMATRMMQSDVDIVIILIDPNGVIDETKVSCLDVKNNGADVIRLPSFDSDAFNAIESRIRAKICSGNNPASTGDQPEYSPWQYCDENGENCSIGLGPLPTRSGGGQGGAADPVEMNKNEMNVNELLDENEGEDEDNHNDNMSSWIYVIIAILMVFIIIICGLLFKCLVCGKAKVFTSNLNNERRESSNIV